jgi:hypothetical protein
MRNMTVFSGFLSFFLALSATGFSQRSIEGDGSDYTESRTVSAFTKLHNSISAEVILVKGNSPGVRIEGEKNIVALLMTEVKDGELDIRFPWMKNIRTTRQLKVWVTTPDIAEVSNSGSGRIHSDDQFKHSNMSIHSSGSGNIEIALDADMLDVGVSGSGGVLVKGDAKQLDCSISGSGRVNGSDLAVREHSDIHISGSGSCTVATNGVLEGHISGSGGINYKGDPSSVNVSHSGSGRARKIS